MTTGDSHKPAEAQEQLYKTVLDSFIQIQSSQTPRRGATKQKQAELLHTGIHGVLNVLEDFSQQGYRPHQPPESFLPLHNILGFFRDELSTVYVVVNDPRRRQHYPGAVAIISAFLEPQNPDA